MVSGFGMAGLGLPTHSSSPRLAPRSPPRLSPSDPVQVHMMRQTEALESIKSNVGCILWFLVVVFVLSLLGSLWFWAQLSSAMKNSY